jgi:hypothetical protein
MQGRRRRSIPGMPLRCGLVITVTYQGSRRMLLFGISKGTAPTRNGISMSTKHFLGSEASKHFYARRSGSKRAQYWRISQTDGDYERTMCGTSRGHKTRCVFYFYFSLCFYYHIYTFSIRGRIAYTSDFGHSRILRFQRAS